MAGGQGKGDCLHQMVLGIFSGVRRPLCEASGLAVYLFVLCVRLRGNMVNLRTLVSRMPVTSDCRRVSRNETREVTEGNGKTPGGLPSAGQPKSTS